MKRFESKFESSPKRRVRLSPGVRAVPVDRVSVGTGALVGGCGAEWKQEAEQQQQRRPSAALRVRLLREPCPAQHLRLLASWTQNQTYHRLRGTRDSGEPRPAVFTMRSRLTLDRCPILTSIIGLIVARWVNHVPTGTATGTQLSMIGPNPCRNNSRTGSSMSDL